MVNPLADAYNMFLGFLQCLPIPVLHLISLIAGLFIIVSIVRIVIQH